MPPPIGGTGNSNNLDLGQWLGLGLGAVGGAFPQTSSQNSSGTGSSNTQGETNTNASSNASFSQFLNNLLNSYSNVSNQQTSSTTPNLSPQTQQLLDQLTSRYQSLAAPSLTGYQAQQTAGINRSRDLQSQAVNNIMASRGLASSPAAGTAQAGVENQRFGDITALNQNIPLLQNQMNQSNLGAATNFFSQIPKGATTTTGGITESVGQQSQAQQTGGQQFANQWGYQGSNQSTNSTQQQQQQASSGGGVGGVLKTVAPLLLSLFSDQRLKKDIRPTEKAVERILKLRPVSWKWKGGEVEDSGLLAQDLLQSNPDLVEKDPQGSGFLKVNYAGLIGTLVGAVQELATEGK